MLFYTGLRHFASRWQPQIVSGGPRHHPAKQSQSAQFAQEFLQGFGGALELKFGEAELSRKELNFELAARVTQGSDRFPLALPAPPASSSGTTTSLVFVTVGGEREWYLQLQQDPRPFPNRVDPSDGCLVSTGELFRLHVYLSSTKCATVRCADPAKRLDCHSTT